MSSCNELLEYYPLHQAWCETKFIKYRENKSTVTRYIHNVHYWHEHKHASVLAIGQPRHQSATALLPPLPHMQQTMSQLINVVNVTATSYLRHM